MNKRERLLFMNCMISIKILLFLSSLLVPFGLHAYDYIVQNQTKDTVDVFLYDAARTEILDLKNKEGKLRFDYHEYSGGQWVNLEGPTRASKKNARLKPGEIIRYSPGGAKCLGGVRVFGPAGELRDGIRIWREKRNEVIVGDSKSRCHSQNYKIIKKDGEYKLEGLEGDITVTHYHPSKEAKAVKIGGGLADYEKIVKTIQKKRLFQEAKDAFFDVEVPHSVHLGTIDLPKKSTYDLDRILLIGKESPIYVEEKLKMPTLEKLMDANKLLFKPNQPKTFPLVDIYADKGEKKIIVTSKTHPSKGGVIKKTILKLDRFAQYLKQKYQQDLITADHYLFFAGYPLLVKLNLTINENGVQVDGLEIHALYSTFWSIVHGPYEKPPQQDFKTEVSYQELVDHNILKTV